MGLLLNVSVDDVNDRIRDYGAGAKLYWARDDASATGSFASASGSTLLVAGQTAYEIYDATGQDGFWYRTRVGDTGGTDFTAWSDVFQAGSLLSYASVTDLREELRLPDDSRDNLLADLLRDASDWLTAECGRDFYRHPQVTGTEVRLYDVAGHATTVVADDIVSLTTVEYALLTGGAYVALAATDWTLAPQGSSPYDRVQLTDTGVLSHFHAGSATVRLTGVFGFAVVPRLIRRATLDIARELYQQSAGGRPVGIEYGRLPPSAVTAKERYTRRTYEYV